MIKILTSKRHYKKKHPVLIVLINSIHFEIVSIRTYILQIYRRINRYIYSGKNKERLNFLLSYFSLYSSNSPEIKSDVKETNVGTSTYSLL